MLWWSNDRIAPRARLRCRHGAESCSALPRAELLRPNGRVLCMCLSGMLLLLAVCFAHDVGLCGTSSVVFRTSGRDCSQVDVAAVLLEHQVLSLLPSCAPHVCKQRACSVWYVCSWYGVRLQDVVRTHTPHVRSRLQCNTRRSF